MTIEFARSLYARLESRRTDSAPNFIAQANARYILFNVNEPRESFPAYRTNLDEGLDGIAFCYLSVGCSLYEKSGIEHIETLKSLEKGGSILEYNHFPVQNRIEESSYFLLISALAFYASGQYSKAFVVMREVEMNTFTGKICAAFLKKDFPRLTDALNEVLLTHDFILQVEDDFRIKNERIRTYLFARAISNLSEYLYTGTTEFREKAYELFSDIMELAEIDHEPSLWWVARLFKLIAKGMADSCVWAIIPPNLGTPQKTPIRELLESLGGISRAQRIEKYLSGLVFRHPHPITELFQSQRKAIEKALQPHGAVICLPTSSGKTRVAELAIFQCLIDSPGAKVLYLAPFRSLAFEVEQTLEKAFEPCGFEVSHLYGGNQFGKVDKMMIQGASVLIATPEKAKAILRADEQTAAQIKLVVVDEGHLIDYTDRYIGHEMFLEELRRRIQINGGKIQLLSAVLPNPEHLAEWIGGNPAHLIKDTWRPSSQRFGLLEFHSNSVSLEWKGIEPSFNSGFVKPIGQTNRAFPNCKREGVAATAVKLMAGGSVLIYVPKANMVKTMAESVLKALELNNLGTFSWHSENDWESFLFSCVECFGENSDLERFAKQGVLCHFGNLPNEIKYFLEKLMRNDKPRIIVATNTLAQGVNLGVSSVIISDVWINPSINLKLTQRDFLNIAGRAGRAFVDSEGKILFAVDRANKVDWYKNMADEYFHANKMEQTTSGLLSYIYYIKLTASKCGIPFDRLLELIAENDFSALSKPEGVTLVAETREFFDKIDDVLLSVQSSFPEEISAEDHFRSSLASIQAQYNHGIVTEDIIGFLRARLKALREKVAPNRDVWKILTTSGLPLQSALALENCYEPVLKIVRRYQVLQNTLENRMKCLIELEAIIQKFPSKQFGETPGSEVLDEIRLAWLSGEQLPKLKGKHDALKICNNYFCFTIPWALNAMARKMQIVEQHDEAAILEELSLSCELGLPTLSSAKVYLAGIRSRQAATELGAILPVEVQESSPRQIEKHLVQETPNLLPNCSEKSRKWLELLNRTRSVRSKSLIKFKPFTLNLKTPISSPILLVKSFGSRLVLCSPDYSEQVPVKNTSDFPFAEIANMQDVYFKEKSGTWIPFCRSPYKRIL